MFNKILQPYLYRTFSTSNSWKNLEKAKPTDINSPDYGTQIAPNEWQKKILLFSGRYKTREEIPPRVSSEMISSAKSWVRVRVSTIMIVAIAVGCAGAIVIIKQKKKEGMHLTERYEINRD